MEDRFRGVQDAAIGHEWLKLIGPFENEANDAKGAEVIAAALAAEDGKEGEAKVGIIIGLDSRAAIGAISALKERGSKEMKAIIITGWDSGPDVLQAIKEGAVYSSSAPNMSYMTQLAVSILDAYTLGYLYPDTTNLHEMNLPPLPERIDITQTLINKDNVQAFIR
jgi:ABC-type sugar transport system substrate-binding protein